MRQNLAVLRDLGYPGVELAIRQHYDAPDQLSEWLHEYDIQVATLITGETFAEDELALSDANLKMRERALARLESFFPLAKELHALVVVGRHRGSFQGNTKARLFFAESLRDACASARRQGLRLAVETINRRDADSLPTLQDGAALVFQVGAENLRLLADTYHMHLEEASLTEPLRTHAALLWHVHFSDTDRLAPGWGTLNFREIVRALREANYSHFGGIEIMQIPDFPSAAEQAIRCIREAES